MALDMQISAPLRAFRAIDGGGGTRAGRDAVRKPARSSGA